MSWCCIGDFNTILGSHEHQGSHAPARLPMLEFQQWSDSHNFFHLPTRGSAFMWSNGRRGRNNTRKRLDRAIVNQQWIDNCVSLSVNTLTKLRSDHFPILLEFQTQTNPFSSSFKFMKMWCAHPDCENIVKQCWNSQVTGCPMFVLNQKLKNLKDALKVWNKNTFGNVHSQVDNAYKVLDEIQMKIDTLGNSDSLMDQEKSAQLQLENALNIEEIFWHEK